jgi:hypothetical protein
MLARFWLTASALAASRMDSCGELNADLTLSVTAEGPGPPLDTM